MTSLGISIAHWERNARATTLGDIKLGVDHCALCQDHHADDCTGCPVKQRTGRAHCSETPYVDAVRASLKLEEVINQNRPQHELQQAWDQWRAAAQTEVEFLKSLRGTE